MTPFEVVRALPHWGKSVVSMVEQKYWARHHAMLVRTGQTISLFELVCQQRLALGPLARTGGIIHKITDEQAVAVSRALYSAAMNAVLPVGFTRDAFIALLFAWVRGESGFDPGCINPNKQDATKPNETPVDVFFHTDIGIGQIDGSELSGLLPDFTWQQQMATALDLTWACPQMASTILAVLAWGSKTAAFMRANGVPVSAATDLPVLPFTEFVLGAQAYNAGRSGALARAVKALSLVNGTAIDHSPFAIHSGVLVLAEKATAADLAYTLRVASASDGTFGYGNTLRSRLNLYRALLGPSPILGC